MKTFTLLILFIGNLLGFALIYSGLFLDNDVTFDTYLILCFITAWFYTNSQINKIDLENQIFELKELIKKKQL